MFEEKQYFTNWLLIPFVIGAVVGCASVIAAGAGPVSIVVICLMMLGFALIILRPMRTSVGDHGVTIKMLIFINRTIAFGNIESVEAITYRPFSENNGWGYRPVRGRTTYDMRGNRGVLLQLKDDAKVLIGSQRADELAASIRGRI